MPQPPCNSFGSSLCRRRWIGLCFSALVVLRTIDSVPRGIFSDPQLNHPAASVMKQLGIQTGPWMMFAPDPVVGNVWMTASIDQNGASAQEWTSPHWSDVDGIDKFRRFRELNFYNRLSMLGNHQAGTDFARYLSRSSATKECPHPSVVLSSHRLKVVPPSTGGIPSDDDVMRILQSRTIATVEAEP